MQMNNLPNTGPEPGSPAPAEHVQRAERRRYVRAFTDGVGRKLRNPGRLSVRPVPLVMVVAVALVAALAIGAVPRILHSAHANPADAAASATPHPHRSTAGRGHGRGRAARSPAAGPSSSAVTPAGQRIPPKPWTAPVPQITTPSAYQPSTSPSGRYGHTTVIRRRTAVIRRRSSSHTPSHGTFWAVTGYGCTQNSTATFSEHGRYASGRNGFISVGRGSLTTDGCNGSFDAMPMSGSATADYRGNYALWTFRTGTVTRGVCHLDVYVPDDPNVEHVGGNPAVYEVFQSAGTTGRELGSFGIDQRFNRGRWVSRHNWPVTSGVLTVKLASRGQDWAGRTRTYAHIAVSPVRITCVA
jgi:hypothetical protein